MPRTIYLYRVTMTPIGGKEPVSLYLYARSKKSAKRFCAQQFDRFDHFDAVKFGETSTYTREEDAAFLDEDEETALFQQNFAGHGEIYSERRKQKGDGCPCTTSTEVTGDT